MLDRMCFTIHGKFFLWTMPVAMRFKRVKRGQYTLEQLYIEDYPRQTPYYLFKWTIRLGFLSFSSWIEPRFLSYDEATEWVHDNIGNDTIMDIVNRKHDWDYLCN